MTETDKILELFRSSDISNHYIASSLIKTLNLDVDYIADKLFHDKSFWVQFSIISCFFELRLFDYRIVLAYEVTPNYTSNHDYIQNVEKDITCRYREENHNEQEFIDSIKQIILNQC